MCKHTSVSCKNMTYLFQLFDGISVNMITYDNNNNIYASCLIHLKDSRVEIIIHYKWKGMKELVSDALKSHLYSFLCFTLF